MPSDADAVRIPHHAHRTKRSTSNMQRAILISTIWHC
jgi:hypothetical protein